VYSLVITNSERLDLSSDEDDGKGIADREVSARLHQDPVSGDWGIVVDPPDHPAAPLIEELYKNELEIFSVTHDLRPWFRDTIMKHVNAVSSGRGQGEYIMPGLGSPTHDRKAIDLLVTLQTCFDELREQYSDNAKFRIDIEGRTSDSARAVDMIADAIAMEFEKGTNDLKNALDRGPKQRGLRTQTDNLWKLRERLSALAESANLTLDDQEEQMKEIEKLLAVAEARLTAENGA
jgi:hypothetical protein